MIDAIYKLAREFDWWTWLCDGCRAKWIARGWQKRDRKQPPYPLTCDECGKQGETE